MANNKRTYISLFSSAGVGCYGFKMEGFECIVGPSIIRISNWPFNTPVLSEITLLLA